MNKAIMICAALLLAGCTVRTGNDSEPSNPGVYRDRVTGCEYLSRGNSSGGLTPRMGADGKQICVARP